MNRFAYNEFLATTLLCMLLCAAPFFVVDWLPMTDLPNHLAQAHLVGKVLSGDRPDMQINWLAPDTLTTWALALLLLALPPLLAAKAMVLCLILSSILGIALLARKVGASVVVVPLSAALLFNQSFYWGFLPFIAGFAAFLFFLAAWFSLGRLSWRNNVSLAALFLLVYFCHIFWAAVAMVAVLLDALLSAERNMKLRALIVSALPVVGLALIWYPSMHNKWASPGFDMAAYWGISLHGRLRPDYAAFALSGLKTDFIWGFLLVPVSFFLGALGWAIAKRRFVSAPIFALATILLAAYLAMPDKYSNTILFSVRWLPYVLILFLLGCLAPIRHAGWRIGFLSIASMMLAGYALLTAYNWDGMDREEMSGLMQAIEKLPPKQTVLGLDFVHKSSWINTSYPFATNAAYAEVFKDAEVNFSFAEQASSLVTYKSIPLRLYQRDLNHSSQMVSRSDVNYFNYVLVNADQAAQVPLAVFLGITPVTHQGRWRLYQVVRSS